MSDYPTAHYTYLAQQQEAFRIQRDLEELFKNTLNQNLQDLSIPSNWRATPVLPIQACPLKFDNPELGPPNYIEPLSDETRETEIREDYAEDSEEDYNEVFLLRKLDEARAELESLKTLIPAQSTSVPLLSGPFWKQPEE